MLRLGLLSIDTMNTVPETAPIPGGNAMSKTFSVEDQN
jgi:hypothetical protein